VLLPSEDQEISQANSTVRIVDGNIFYVHYKKDITIQQSDFEETLASYNKLAKGEKLKFLVVFPEFSSATPEARKFAEDHQADCIAEAIVFRSLAQRILIKFYMMFRKQTHPVKIFTSLDTALTWLKAF
jgi:hypothetical protein